jgi:hypothetical protein
MLTELEIHGCPEIAVDAVVAPTDCDREQVTAFIRRLYLVGVKDPKRLAFKGSAGDRTRLTAKLRL